MLHLRLEALDQIFAHHSGKVRAFFEKLASLQQSTVVLFEAVGSTPAVAPRVMLHAHSGMLRQAQSAGRQFDAREQGEICVWDFREQRLCGLSRSVAGPVHGFPVSVAGGPEHQRREIRVVCIRVLPVKPVRFGQHILNGGRVAAVGRHHARKQSVLA
jgi:hypothetical protein